jgi:putative oxidoreductase
MNILQRFEYWGDHHHPKYLDIVRILLGVFLFYKGIDFLQNLPSVKGELYSRTSFGEYTVLLLGHYVVFAHIIGGILLIIGLFTRFACLIQLPVLLGAIIFINSGSSAIKPYSELLLSIVILLLLCYFLVIGNGPWSIKFTENEQRHV